METRVFPDADALAQAAAQEMVEYALACVAQRGRFGWALSGGSTPLKAYRLLGQAPLVDQAPWEHIHLFWGDERCVMPDQPASNFVAAQEAMGFPDRLPVENIHRIPAEYGSDEGSTRYEETLAEWAGDGGPPVLDLIWLGMGPDGHVASLFPGDNALKETSRWVVGVPPPRHLDPAVARVSLTLPVLNRARRLRLLITGATKSLVAAVLLAGKVPEAPAARLEPSGDYKIYLDREAAGKRGRWD